MDNKQQNPRVQVPLQTTDWLLEIAGWLLLAGLWVLALSSYPQLPQSIPTHYDGQGNPDDYGTKATLLLLPSMATLIAAIISWLNRFPHKFNFPVTITEENAAFYYTKLTRLMRVLKAGVAGVFCYINYITINTALGVANGLGKWFLPTVLVLFLGATTAYMVSVGKREEDRM